MERLKRQILYVKPKAEKKGAKSDGTIKFQSGILVVPAKDKKLITALENHPHNAALPGRLEQSKKISEWITTHPEFKWSAMCKKLKIDKGNFQRSTKATPPNIKQEFISKIEKFLSNYGYGK